MKPPYSGSLEGAITEVIDRDRGCDKRFSFIPDLEPTEHVQELRVAELQNLARRQVVVGALAEAFN